ncbi:AAA family ATPase [Candidatus Thiothrix sp. Deng01]|uniref:AAA family ATPase n=1 Tax=Candidatus Thiothrix phosphatis TaxID=3112415 RepID=A0ABU6CX33_9GAMM|nr:AAA family ATPase [Candidatus Thiothrix sp. Deng01]MEB4590674.1 AAA family ATPase [Candidatus Thiothrix sp. Deng01]
MRIDRLDLLAYGGFTDKTLDLSHGSQGLHLIYGDNEAGKSTALRAIIAWLFGIPMRTTDNYRHEHAQLRIGGKLRLANGQSLEFIRRKGSKGTLLASDGNAPLDDAVLAPFLPNGVDETLFSKLYGIDHERLEAGGRELLNQSGDLGQALFGAALGVASPRIVLQGLQAEADELYKPKASKPVVNQALAGFKEAHKRTKECTLPVGEWTGLQTGLVDTLAGIAQIETQIQANSREKSRLQRLQRVRGPLAERHSTRQQLADLAQVQLLPEDFEAQYQTAASKQQTASEARDKARVRLAGLQADIQALDMHDELLVREAEILDIYKQLGAVEKTLKDRPQQDGQRRLLRNEARNLLQAVHSGLDIDEAAKQLRPLLKNKSRVGELARQHGLLAQRRETAKRNLQEADEEKRQVLQQLAVLPASPVDVRALKTAVAAVRRQGDLEGRLSAARKLAAESQLAAEDDFRRLGRFAGSMEALAQTAMPLPATLDDFEQQLQESADTLRNYANRQQELAAERAQAGRELEALLLHSDAPTLAQLQASRTARDQLWRRIRQHYIDGGQTAAPAAEAGLPTLYEQQRDEADHLADRLRLEAEQVAKRNGLETRLQTLAARLEQLQQAWDAIHAIQQRQQQDWESVWQPLQVEAGTPREMKQWLNRVDKVLSGIRAAKEQQSHAINLAGEYDFHQAAIAAHLAGFDPALDPQGMGLGAMLAICEQRIEQEEQLANRQQQLQAALADADSRIARTQESNRLIAEDLSVWGQEWLQAIEGLGVKADAYPEYAVETLTQLEAFFHKFDAATEKHNRIYGMDIVERDFEQQVFAFVDEIGRDKGGHSASILATQLHQDLNKAREAKAKLEKIREAEKAEQETIREAEVTFASAAAQLASLKALAGVENEAALLKASEDSRHKRTLQHKLAALEQELMRNGDGLSLDGLEQEAAAADTDALEPSLMAVSPPM